MSTSPSKLKKQILTLLKEDEEFRYAIAGIIGLEEILKRLDKHAEELAKLREDLNKLREDMNKGFEKHDKEITKLWGEIKLLREGQEKLWEETKALREGQNKLWEEVKALRETQERLWENQNKLWEGQNKLWEEVRLLREGQNKLWEGQNKLWEEVRALREGQNKLWDEAKRLRAYMVSGFTELKTALGVTYEMHAAAYIEVMLDEMGYTGARVEKKYIVHEGEILDIDIFCENPLIVGEVTVAIRDKELASREIEKLFGRVNAIKTMYGKTPEIIILSVGSAPEEVANYLREESEKKGFKLILGREIEEAFSPA